MYEIEGNQTQVFNRISESCAALDLDWRFTYANEAFGRIFEREPARLIGKVVWEEFPESFTQDCQAAYRKAMQEQVPMVLEESWTPNGMLMENRIYPSSDGLTVFFLDITLRKREENALRQLNKELEKRIGDRTVALADKHKAMESFTHSVSHDLRAPLRSISGYSKLLLFDYEKDLDDQGRRFLENIQAGAAKLHAMLEDLVAYSNLEQKPLSIKNFNMGKIVASVVLERKADLIPVRLKIEIAPDEIVTDVEGVIISLRNVLDNAIKFSKASEPSSIEIRSRIEGDRHILTISDNGIGFDMKHHDSVFRIFQRLQRAGEYPGSGVGLTLVKKAMDRIGGRVWAESAPNLGTVFSLDFPRAPIW